MQERKPGEEARESQTRGQIGLRIPHPASLHPSSKSSAPATTISRTSTSRFRSARLTAVTGVSRQRQELADRRHSLQPARQDAPPREHRRPARTTRSAASSRSTK